MESNDGPGFGLGFAQTSCPTYVAETAPPQHRAVALGLYYACWGVGTLVASGVCYSVGISTRFSRPLLTSVTQTQHYTSTWAWRTPSLVQIIPSLLCMAVLLFLPESPRWLIDKDRHDEALEVLAAMNANGDKESPFVLVQYREITDTIAWEKSQQLSWKQAFSSKGNRKRIILTSTFSIIVMLPGTNIITFYFGDMLSQAGISNPTTQLEINIILTSWTLVVSLVGAWFADAMGRKTLCSISLAGQIVTFYILAGLTSLYGASTNKSGIYGTIAMIFLYNASYAYGITPLTVLYPPEVLSYSLRSVGMGLYTLTTKLSGLLVTMAFPFALEAIGWKTYIINASADIVMLAGVMWYWVETRGFTLEEVDKVFDGEKHSDVPDLKAVQEGEVEVGSELLKGANSRIGGEEVEVVKGS